MSVSKMKKLTVFAFREDSEKIIRRLLSLRCVEVREADVGREEHALSRLNADEQLTAAEKRIGAIEEALPILAKHATGKKGLRRRVLRVNREEFLADGRADAAWNTVQETLNVRNTLRDLSAESTRNATLAESLLPWLEYDLPLNETSTAKTVTVLGAFPSGSSMENVEKALAEAGAEPEFVFSDSSGNYYAITYLRSDEEEISQLLAANDFLKADLPTLPERAQKLYDEANAQIEHIDEASLQQEELLRTLAEKKDDVEILYDIEETNRITAKLRQKLAQTNHCAVLEGWFPANLTDAVTSALDVFECCYEIEDPAPDDNVPVLLRNNPFATNFEWVIGMYSYPRYGTFDPTFIMSIFYFIIFGLMFADVGYGLLLSILCFGAVKLLNPRVGLKRMLLMFGYCGISSAIMGAIFGGWFGDLPTAVMTNILHLPVDTSVGHFFSNGLWLNPIDDPMTFLIISLGVGAVHLLAGMAIKFFILCKNGSPLEAICTIVPFWVLFAGLGLFLVDGNIAKYVALAGALLILLLNGYGQKGFFGHLLKGFSGLYSLISYASDLLSYSRILALGMVAGVIAKVINLITALGTLGPIGFIPMLIVLLLGHGLNIGINILGTFVHAARLQYIEFFGKFFEDGGEPFQPALPSEQYSEDIQDSTR